MLSVDAEIEEYEAFMLAQPSKPVRGADQSTSSATTSATGWKPRRTRGRRQRHQHRESAAHAGLAAPPRLAVNPSPSANPHRSE